MKKYKPEIFAFIKKERQRIDQDAHDKVYNRLGALAKRAESLSCDLTSQKDKLEEISQSIRQTISDLQDIISGNQSSSVFELTSATQNKIRQVCQEHVVNYGQQIAFTCQSGRYDLLDNQNIWHLQCILQECLNNAGKHSKATRVDIDLKENNHQLIMRVADNGQGISKVESPKFEVRSGGQGLEGIKQRVAALGGKLDLESTNQGTAITVKIPLKKDKAN